MISTNPEALALSAAVEAAGGAGLAAGAGAAAEPMTAVLPAGPSPLLAMLATVANVRGAMALTALGMLTGSKELYSGAIGLSGVGYEAVNATATAAMTL